MATKSKEKRGSEQTAITPVGTAMFVYLFHRKTWDRNKGRDRDDDNDERSSKKNSNGEYSMVLVFDKDTNLKALKRICLAAARKKWGDEKGEKLFKSGKLQLPFRDGEEYEQHGEPFDEDHIFIRAKSNNRPGVVDQRREDIEDEFDVYAGMKARMSVYAHPYETSGNKGVTLLLNNVQKCGDGERLSGRGNAEDDFDDGQDFDDDEDDAPRKKSKNRRDEDDDEDEDERPRKKSKKRSRDEDDDDDIMGD